MFYAIPACNFIDLSSFHREISNLSLLQNLRAVLYLVSEVCDYKHYSEIKSSSLVYFTYNTTLANTDYEFMHLQLPASVFWNILVFDINISVNKLICYLLNTSVVNVSTFYRQERPLSQHES